MKRLASLVLAAGFIFSLLLVTGQGAFATPFSDVPANHWAYQALQSLAADGLVEGYPDGKFKGDRPLSRYEMAVLTARVIAKVEANGASKADLDKLQKLIDALKDELDALGVRVTNLEDALDALDKRTKFAQSVEFHGLFQPNISEREKTQFAKNVNGSLLSGEAVGNFVNAFLFSDFSNNALSAAGGGIRFRSEDKFAFTYHVNEQIDVSLPIHLLTYDYGGEYPAGSSAPHISYDPAITIKVAKAGALSNVVFKYGQIDDMKASRTGLAFAPPVGTDQGYFGYTYPLQPFQRGMSVAGTLLGLTDWRVSFTRVDQVALGTQAGNIGDPSGDANFGYLNAIVPTQFGYQQPNAAGVLTANTFSAGTGPLSQVYLTQKGVLGSVFVSAYNGATYNSNRSLIAGPPGSLAAAPGFTYNDATNSVVFNPPLPAGSAVTLSYTGLNYSGNSVAQRYMVNARINQKIKGWKGAEIGVTFNRIFDYDDINVSGTQTVITNNTTTSSGFGLVSDTVLGIDFQLPLPYEISGKGSNPIIFGEAAASKFTADYRNVPAQTDTAGVIGLRLKIQTADISATYQSIGPGYLDGAPIRYFGNAPPLFSFWKLPYFPAFFGFANSAGINLQLDNAFTAGSAVKSPATSNNPNLTFIYPVFNQFQGGGQFFYQNAAYMPNTRGPSLNVTTPVKIGDTTFNARLTARSLSEIRPNSFGQLVYGAGGASNVLETYNTVSGGVGVNLPAFGQKVSLDVSGSWEKLRRNDLTPAAYLPINPSTGSIDAATALAVATAFGISPSTGAPNSPVSFYPNYINDTRWTLSLNAAVPITRDVSLSGFYNTQRFGGSYGTTATQNISERKDWYSAAVTYTIPKTASSVSFSAKQYRYQDDVLPSFNATQNRQDVNFTVRF